MGSSSLGITRLFPFAVQSFARLLPGAPKSILWVAGTIRQHLVPSMVSHQFDGLLRAATAGLLHPAAGLEVRHVLQGPQPDHPKVPWPSALLPATRFIPFKGFPLSVAVPHHCGRCPLTVVRLSPRPYPTPANAGADDRSAAEASVQSLHFPPTEAGVGGPSTPKRRRMVRTEPQPKLPLERIASEETMPLRTRSGRGRCLCVFP